MPLLAAEGVSHLGGYVFISSAMFVLGIFTMVTRRNAIYVLMGAELILNAAALNFVAFSHYVHGLVAGQVVALFIIVLAAAEAAIALAIVLSIFRAFQSIDAEDTATLRE